MSVSSLAKNGKVLQHINPENDNFPSELIERFVACDPLVQSEMEKLHHVLSKHILDCHKRSYNH